jgi:hypothetical protein
MERSDGFKHSSKAAAWKQEATAAVVAIVAALVVLATERVLARITTDIDALPESRPRHMTRDRSGHRAGGARPG